MPTYTEQDLAVAVEAVHNGASLRAASRTHKIPVATIAKRVQGVQPRRVAQQNQQKLSTAQETRLANWVAVEIVLGHRPKHQQIKVAAAAMIGVPLTDIGKNWIDSFLKRNPECKPPPRTKAGRAAAAAAAAAAGSVEAVDDDTMDTDPADPVEMLKTSLDTDNNEDAGSSASQQ